jgi:hypothetical protein
MSPRIWWVLPHIPGMRFPITTSQRPENLVELWDDLRSFISRVMVNVTTKDALSAVTLILLVQEIRRKNL